MSRWRRGVLREKLFDLPVGTVVVMANSGLNHTSIDKTYWIVSPEYKKAYHIADTYAGRDCKYLVRQERVAKDDEVCFNLWRRCTAQGQFGPEHKHEISKLLSRS